MARIRTIKPEFWSDEDIAKLAFEHRLLFIGLWNHADDQGLIENRPTQLRIRIFPLDDVDVEAGINHLIKLGMLDVYECDGKEILHIRHWERHQTINRPSKPVYQWADLKKVDSTTAHEHSNMVHEPSVSTHGNTPETGKIDPFHGALSEYSVSTHSGRKEGEEWKGKEGTVSANADPSPTATKRGTRLTEDFIATSELRQWAATKCPLVDVNWETEKFNNHFKSVSGTKGVKKDWDRTWQNWMMRAQDDKTRFAGNRHSSANESVAAARWAGLPE